MLKKTERLSLPIDRERYLFKSIWYNLSPEELADHIVQRGEGVLTSKGVPLCSTGSFTGRSPQDRFIVQDEMTASSVVWGDINKPIETRKFTTLMKRMIASLYKKQVYVRDVSASRASKYRLKVRIISTTAYHSLFACNMFITADQERIGEFKPDITVLVDPFFHAVPQQDGTNSKHFIIMDIRRGIVCIGGTGYTGEVKKSIFSILNFILPHRHGVLSMHCGANRRKGGGPSALFFGLSGTGKTTLSSDPKRLLIGDDEHGWDDEGIFNLEDGCYAKVINISETTEPLIWQAIKPYALLENILMNPQGEVDYTDDSVTENMRVSYPLEHIKERAVEPIAPHPGDVFFLSCDAFGVLPPLSLLTDEQALFYFKSGYTARITGTEQGIKEPTAVFSPGFAAPFLPLPIEIYVNLLHQYLSRHKPRVWLVNTGWVGGAYGIGRRYRAPLHAQFTKCRHGRQA